MDASAQARLEALLAEPAIATLIQALSPAGEETRIVGGAVRNALLGVAADDVDLATTLKPEETLRRGESIGWKAIPTGIEHGTITLLNAGRSYEVTTLRRDIETDGRHARVVFGRDFQEDAARRDFTINAMSLGVRGHLFDYFDGAADLAARRVRFIGNPETRLREDYLRGLRFLRFSARYGKGGLDSDGLAAMIALQDGFAGLSRERVRQEVLKLLMAPMVIPVLAEADGVGLLSVLLGLPADLPRFAARATLQGRLGHVEWPPLARLAALLPSSQLTEANLQDRLRLSKDEMRWLAQLAAAESLIKADVSHLASRLVMTAPEAAAEALRLAASRQADPDGLLALVSVIATHPRFLLSGRDLLAAGWQPGPALGAKLAALIEMWILAGAPEGEADQRRLLAQFLAR
jgi:poly(A) polymerase